MKYTETTMGRVFVVRLEDGDVLHECIESFAGEHGVRAGVLIAVGGVDSGSRLIVGPEAGRAQPVMPMEHILDAVHEAAGVGTLFPDEDGTPILHMHAACGRETETVTGCVRSGVRVWHVLELVLIELADAGSLRKFDPGTGFKLLEP